MSRARVIFVTTAVCLFAAVASYAGINFAGLELTTVSPRPEFMATGDLNSDGLTDVVVVSPQSHELNVFLGADTPSRFAGARVVRFGQTLRLPAIGDINSDGRPDVVVADQAAQIVWILLGKGDGTFLAPYQNNVPNSRNPYAIAIANFDDVGGPELAITDSRLAKVFVLRNDNATEPRFSRLVELNTGEEPTDVRAVDLNHDGHVDLLTLDTGGPRVKNVSILIWKRAQLGTPDFAEAQKFTVGEKPSDLVVADFTGDGNADIAMLNKASGVGNGEIDALVSTGNGVFLPPVSLPIPCPFFTGGAPCKALTMAAADFDGNGTVDLAVTIADPRRSRGSASALADAMQIFSDRGDGVFVPGGVFAVQKNPQSMAVGDVTGDGKTDIIVANQRTLSLQCFINVSSPADLGNGAECLRGDECISNRCLNGVCCGSQCILEDNEVCNVPGREGICTPLVPTPIECEFPEDCDTGFCSDGFCCDEDCTGGRCDKPGYIGLCIPGAIDGSDCNGDGRECESGFCSPNFICCKESCEGGFCDELGDCHGLLDNSQPCDVDEECASNVCDVFDQICCNRKCNEDAEFCSDQGKCTPFGSGQTVTPDPDNTPTPTATRRSTPVPAGNVCSVGAECTSTFCVDGVCCQVASCGTGEFCEEGSGTCVTGTPAGPRTATPTRTPLPTQPSNPCSPNPCPSGQQCISSGGQAQCIVTSSSGGCSTGGNAPAGANMLVVSLMPLGLWLGRRWQLRRATVRARTRRQ